MYAFGSVLSPLINLIDVRPLGFLLRSAAFVLGDYDGDPIAVTADPGLIEYMEATEPYMAQVRSDLEMPQAFCKEALKKEAPKAGPAETCWEYSCVKANVNQHEYMYIYI